MIIPLSVGWQVMLQRICIRAFSTSSESSKLSKSSESFICRKLNLTWSLKVTRRLWFAFMYQGYDITMNQVCMDFATHPTTIKVKEIVDDVCQPVVKKSPYVWDTYPKFWQKGIVQNLQLQTSAISVMGQYKANVCSVWWSMFNVIVHDSTMQHLKKH